MRKQKLLKNSSCKSRLLAALLMVTASLLYSVTAMATDFTGTYYFDNSVTKWEKVYLIIGKSNWVETIEMVGPDCSGKYTQTIVGWSDASSFFFAPTRCDFSEGSASGNIDKDLSSYTYTAKQTTKPSDFMFVPSSSSGAAISGAWSAYSSPTAPVSVLNGTKVMFYIGEETGWNQYTFYLKKNSSIVATAPSVVENDNKRYGTVTVEATTGYTITHGTEWDGKEISGTPVQGGAYYVNNSGCTVVNGTALTASVTLASASITQGSNVTISASSKSTGILGLTSQIKYYATTDNATFTELSVSESSLQTSGLATGTWTIIPVFYDTHIYCKGTTTTLTVGPAGSAPTVLLGAAPTVAGNVPTLSGYLKFTGCQDVTEYGFIWSETEANISSSSPTGTKSQANKPGTTIQSGTGAGTEFTLDNLSFDNGKTYYYKAYAKNIVGTSYSEDYLSFSLDDGCSEADKFELETSYAYTVNACDASKQLAAITVKGSGTLEGSTYLWTPSTGLSSATVAQPEFTGTANASYSVKVSKSAECYRTTTYNVTYVNNTPSSQISGNSKTLVDTDLVLTGTSSAESGYSWSAFDSENVEVTESVLKTDGLTATFNSSTAGTYTVKLTTPAVGTCEAAVASHSVEVRNGFYVYVKQPSASDSKYTYFWEKTTDKESALYMKTGVTENTTANNDGGTQMTLVTDCNGVQWNRINITALSVSGLSFHPANDKDKSAWATYTKFQAGPFTDDVYFEVGAWIYGNQGSEISTIASTATVAAIRNDTEFNSADQTDFVGLYVSSTGLISFDKACDKVKSYQWEFSSDGTAWSNYSNKASLTGDAGTSDNIRVRTEGYYHCVLTIEKADKSAEYTVVSSNIHVTSTNGSTKTYCSNLPVINVRTNSDFPTEGDMKAKITCDVQIYWNDGSGNDLYYDRKARLNYRGSSSMNFPKKSYAFVCGDANTKADGNGTVKTAKLPMFGLGANAKDWVLYAAYPDITMMRNKISYDTYSEMTDLWAPKSRYVELYVDGEYRGVYVFMDKITQGIDRANVNKNTGYIFKFDKTDEADRYNKQNPTADDKLCTFMSKYSGCQGAESGVDQMFEIAFPEREDDPENWSNKVEALQKKINDFEAALKDRDWEKVRSMIDYQSWADWFIINEFTKNADSYRISNMFILNSIDDKIVASPIWDYELGLNNYAQDFGKDIHNATNWLYSHSDMHTDSYPIPFWVEGIGCTNKGTGTENKTITDADNFGGLLDDPCFVSMVKNRWALHSAEGQPLDADQLDSKLTACDNVLSESTTCSNKPIDRELDKWSIDSRRHQSGYYTAEHDYSYSNQKSEMSAWFKARSEGLDDLVNGLAGGNIITVNVDHVSVTKFTPVELTATTINSTPVTWTLSSAGSYLENVSDHTVITEDSYKGNSVILKPADSGSITATTTDEVCGAGEVSKVVEITVNAEEEKCD